MSKIQDLLAKASQLPWIVRELPNRSPLDTNEPRKFFVQASKNNSNDPYIIEVMGEDTGRLYPDDQKRADADLIVAAVSAVADIELALDNYAIALANHEHGGIAAHRTLGMIEKALGRNITAEMDAIRTARMTSARVTR